jgi:hypothetical protein
VDERKTGRDFRANIGASGREQGGGKASDQSVQIRRKASIRKRLVRRGCSQIEQYPGASNNGVLRSERGSFLTDIPFETRVRELREHYEWFNDTFLRGLTKQGRIMTHEDCVKITPPQENIDREAAQMGGKESMVRQKLKEIGDVLRQQVVGDFHVAEVQQGGYPGYGREFHPNSGPVGMHS